MADEQIVDVSYRGLEVGSRLRLFEFGPSTAYLETPQPMPVGSVVSIQAEGDRVFEATVLRVQEQVAGAEHPPGMCVRPTALEGALADWWNENVSRQDPVIPEPAVEVKAPADEPIDAEPEVAAEPAMDSEPTTDAERSDGVPDEAEGDNSARRTSVMDVSEIQAVIAAGGDVADLVGDGGGDGHSRPTMEMPAVELAAAVEASASEAKSESDDDDDKPNGKKKKRRRRKRKTKAP